MKLLVIGRSVAVQVQDISVVKPLGKLVKQLPVSQTALLQAGYFVKVILVLREGHKKEFGARLQKPETLYYLPIISGKALAVVAPGAKINIVCCACILVKTDQVVYPKAIIYASEAYAGLQKPLFSAKDSQYSMAVMPPREKL